MYLKIIPILFFIYSLAACKGTSVTKPDSQSNPYQSIRSNVARVQAMLSGKFVQQTRVDTFNNYVTWMVNDNQDSMVMYSIPVGDPNKNGHWLYHYQIMTSLPNEPIYEAFEKLTEVDRDSIHSRLYLPPANFNLPLSELLQKRKNAFASVKLDSLSADEDAGYYIRQNSLFFKNQTDIGPNAEYNVYSMDIYEVHPTHMMFYTLYYKDPEGEVFLNQFVSKFIRLPTLD